MRLFYTSPRQENIDRMVVLLGEHGIKTRVMNRSSWNRPGYPCFSYIHGDKPPDRDNENWPQVWVCHADDYPHARQLLREMGMKPGTVNAEAFCIATRRQHTVTRIRRIMLLVIGAVFLWTMLHVFNLAD